jgi:hypothetical protein
MNANFAYMVLLLALIAAALIPCHVQKITIATASISFDFFVYGIRRLPSTLFAGSTPLWRLRSERWPRLTVLLLGGCRLAAPASWREADL